MTSCHFCYGHTASRAQWLVYCFDSLVLTTLLPLMVKFQYLATTINETFPIVQHSIFCMENAFFFLHFECLLGALSYTVTHCCPISVILVQTYIVFCRYKPYAELFLSLCTHDLCLHIQHWHGAKLIKIHAQCTYWSYKFCCDYMWEQILFEKCYNVSLKKREVVLLWELFWWLYKWMGLAVFQLVKLS